MKKCIKVIGTLRHIDDKTSLALVGWLVASLISIFFNPFSFR